MAVAYDPSRSKNRLRYGDGRARRAQLSSPTDVNLHQGDMLFYNSSDQPVQGSQLPTQASLSAAQQAAKTAFLGVSIADFVHNPQNPRPVRNVPSVYCCDDGDEFEYDLAAATNTIKDGTLLGVHAVDNGGNFEIVDNVLVEVSNVNEAIAIASGVYAGDTITTVRAKMISTIRDRGVQAVV